MLSSQQHPTSFLAASYESLACSSIFGCRLLLEYGWIARLWLCSLTHKSLLEKEIVIIHELGHEEIAGRLVMLPARNKHKKGAVVISNASGAGHQTSV